MNIQDKISALEAEKAAADARITKAKAQTAAANQRASENSARASKAEAEILSCFRVQTFQKTRNSKFYRKCELLEVKFDMA